MQIKTNLTNDQIAFEYALYMMASSYFNKTTCMNKMTERNMLVQYKEQKNNSQYFMEETCLRLLEEHMAEIPAEIFNQKVEAYLKKDPVTHLTEIEFLGYNYYITFRGMFRGTQSEIAFRYGNTEEFLFLAA